MKKTLDVEPNDVHSILLVYPAFSSFGFWNYKEICRLRGASYPAAPLGLITLAALLPDSWSMKLVDMNTTRLTDRDIDEADLVFIGGMLPQQGNFLSLIDRVHSRGKKVVAGGPDPTSQPELYEKADFLVLGEVENSITGFLNDLAAGAERGVYYPDEVRPDITTSPIPRFDLLDFDAYLMVGIQVTRGCPYNCEFCDIIELYGRKPRTKTPEQLVTELETLYRLGYRGHVDFVDDNFIGNKRKAKTILEATRDWSRAHGHPFCFSTEASINLADNDELLTLMRDTDFRYVFVGIESADEHVLASTNKKTNLRRDIVQDIQKILSYGIVVNGGFIIGFDNETSASVRVVTETIDGGRICMAMIGLLYALPNTQLTRRLAREGRLLASASRVGLNDDSTVDQATSGLNFTTRRARSEVYRDYEYVLEKVYARKAYFDRCLQLGLTLRRRAKHKRSLKEQPKAALAFIKLMGKLVRRPASAYYFWRNVLVLLFRRPSSLEETVNLMALYLHFRKQTDHILKLVNRFSAAEEVDVPPPIHSRQRIVAH